MKNKYIILISILTITILAIISILSTNTYAYQPNTNNATLFYKENINELENNIKKYLTNIDNILIPNSMFNESHILTENYDFLTYFAIDYILENLELYQDKIKKLDEHYYITREGYEQKTNNYIDVEEIYKITNKFFNIDYYYITNNDIKIIDNNISLINYTASSFKLEIESVKVTEQNNYIYATVTYENNNIYKYTFINENNILTFQNIEVVS